MGTITDKINYLSGTKSQLKDMINYGLPTENQITNETTFRNYVKGIFEAFIESLRDSSTLYTNLPKISGNGTQITLNDTTNAPMRITLKASELSQDATPTPSSPQDIHTISGDNSVVVEGKNLIGQDNISSLSTATGTYNGNTMTFVSTATYKKVEWFIPVKVGDKFTFSCGGNDTLYLGLFEYSQISTSSDYRLRAIAWDIQITTNGQVKKFTIQNDGYLRVYIGSQPTGTYTISNIQLERGEIDSPTYTPYVSQTNPINLGEVENLINILTLSNGYVNAAGGITGTTSNEERVSPFIKVKPNTAYTFKIFKSSWSGATNDNWIGIGEYSSNDTSTFIQRDTMTTGTQNYITFTTTATTQYVMISARGLMEATEIQFSEDTLWTNKNSYTPYGTTPIKYCKIGDYEDEFIYNTTDTNLELNKWYLKKNIGKVVLDGSETWNERTNAGGIKQFYAPTNLPTNSVLNATQICTHFSNYVQNLFNYGGVGQFAILTNTRQFFAGVEDTLLLEDFKTSLANNNLETYYVLSTPTYTKITGTLETQLNNIYKNMLSYKGTTNVSQISNDLPFVLGVSALENLGG